jgi:hypothetical protein
MFVENCLKNYYSRVTSSDKKPAGNPTTTYRLEQNWNYTYAVGFRSSGCSPRMVCEKPKHYIVLAVDVS